MAREPSAEKVAAAATNHAGDLEAEIAALRSDIASITDTLGKMAKDTSRAAKEEVGRAKDQVLGAAEETKEKVIAEYERYEDELQSAIRERPITSVLIAAGIGYIVSKIL